MTVTVRYFAGARAAAGVGEEPIEAATLGELREQVAARHGADLARVLPACSLLVDGVSARVDDTPLPVGVTVDVLPPFAGG